MSSEQDLDAILDSCLEDFDAADVVSVAPQPTITDEVPPSPQHSPAPPTQMPGSPGSLPGFPGLPGLGPLGSGQDMPMPDAEEFQKMMATLLNSDMGKSLFQGVDQDAMSNMMKELERDMQNVSTEQKSPSPAEPVAAAAPAPAVAAHHPHPSGTETQTTNSEAPAYDQSVENAMKMLSGGARQLPGLNAETPFGEGDESLQKLFAQLGNLVDDNSENKEGMDQFVETIMKEMVSKEYMYEPMKAVAEKYPAFLSENKGKISDNEYQNYEKQYATFQKIVKELETDNAESKTNVMKLFDEMQQYGQPPPSVASSMIPGMGGDPTQGAPPFNGPTGPASEKEMAEFEAFLKQMSGGVDGKGDPNAECCVQ